FLALKAEALHLADRTFEALEAIREAEGLVERFGEHLWRADLHRLRGVLLMTIGADETQIEASFRESYPRRKGAEVDFTRESGGSKLRRVPQQKGKALEAHLS